MPSRLFFEIDVGTGGRVDLTDVGESALLSSFTRELGLGRPSFFLGTRGGRCFALLRGGCLSALGRFRFRALGSRCLAFCRRSFGCAFLFLCSGGSSGGCLLLLLGPPRRRKREEHRRHKEPNANFDHRCLYRFPWNEPLERDWSSSSA